MEGETWKTKQSDWKNNPVYEAWKTAGKRVNIPLTNNSRW